MKSETPTKDNLPAPYKMNPNAPARTSRQENYSTADYNLQKQRKEAHSEALSKEDRHYADVHSTSPRAVSSKPEKKPSNYKESLTGYR
jgi:hypothetical protein